MHQHTARTIIIQLVMSISLAVSALGSENPLLLKWNTPFGVPPYDQIKPENFPPAFDAAMLEYRKEIDGIAGQSAAPSFENTIEALDRTGLTLAKVSGVFFNLSGAETNPQIQAIAKEIAPKLAALRDDIFLNEALFKRVETVWGQRSNLSLNAEGKMLLKKTYEGFVRGGIQLQPEQKTRLRAINGELSVLGVRFGDQLLKETNDYRLVIETQEDLAGLPSSQVDAAAEAAKGAGLEGKWLFTLQAPSIWPFLQYADNRDLRRQIFQAYLNRGSSQPGNRDLAAQMAALRAEKAQLLGYKDWASFVLEENMARTSERVFGLLDQLWRPALAKAISERDEFQQEIRKQGGDFKLEPWDWRYYAERVRRAKYDLDEEAVKPYFSLEQVRTGAFTLARKLYGIEIVERTDIPKYHPEVKTFEVRDRDGSHIGVLLVDYHPRPGKRGGAWMGNIRDQWMDGNRDIRPIVFNVGNFSRPTADAPALLTLEEVETLFHEFGHALHGLLSKCRYRSLSGTEVPRDFVELPSQIMESWVLEPQLLEIYAKHYQTGERIPDSLVKKLKDAELFNQGFVTVEYLAASYLDMDWHTQAGIGEVDPVAFEKQSLGRIHLIPEIPSRYSTGYFNHIFGPGGGYAAGYYSYIWSEVLDADAFEAFKEKGIFDQATAASFRANILERGGTEDGMDLYRRFRGREPSVEPLLVRRGLK